MTDCIHLSRIRGYGYMGALPEEQILGQWFEVDLTLWLDLSKPGRSDVLADTLDYCNVIDDVQTLIKTSKFLLLEKLAETIADKILNYQQVNQVQVKVVKPAAPIPGFDGKITIDILRKKG
ncbi:dihydroneopterin aldolase family protein [Leptolyngbya boryana NIES-2135]|jgi:dihydroneopterin aldolase|uniref:7,8-dihydroneopterin aldolase n=1 Tax=Leptolyngbya boryana NIES-2135 TaxID=1973484 RepID=A0A1Z4JBZ0_LEPBY|nr:MULTISPECIES: dihydroneopterin aldolase [Leptolyngbya]BAY54272.1 dihydroneopterin aldolase family protein [Leptolyngbya boryana NIES-2135]MBD2370859.1 dihydroneopterin aldolase [Leptolyngbya sp. FACHB-161]MBD2377143.1 dihydroneopterin aldolase [Leptolyngbya sp. FACHB-238]MBD2401647.1 dihydroneopterin aldolase [Leptolyngbya sp. FACHB-239]MBD2408200.1 dihydroneopterin aldolase [Leptolyngbya sp. FACHB-402]